MSTQVVGRCSGRIQTYVAETGVFLQEYKGPGCLSQLLYLPARVEEAGTEDCNGGGSGEQLGGVGVGVGACLLGLQRGDASGLCTIWNMQTGETAQVSHSAY